MLHRDRVTWVSRKAFGLSDGSVCQHPFELSEDWTLDQMQTIYESCKGMAGSCGLATQKPPREKIDLNYSKIVQALEAFQYNQTKTAAFLRVSHQVLRRRLIKYHITHSSWYHKKLKGVDAMV